MKPRPRVAVQPDGDRGQSPSLAGRRLTVGRFNALPRQAGEKDPSLQRGNGRTWLEEEQRQHHDSLLRTGRCLPGASPQRKPTTPTATAASHGAGSGPGIVSSRPVTQRRARSLPYPTLPSPLPSTQATPDRGKSFFSIYTHGIFLLKECLPQMGTISFYTSNQVYLTLKENW